uniref:Uncharacterized protein n=1 Tax=uncultured Dokdonia sp. TaxID=575653 RepID=H6RFQ4_9FLAO|nr:hypothetical protein VIS_S18CAA120038 [uncultured Dokdonia sp.]
MIIQPATSIAIDCGRPAVEEARYTLPPNIHTVAYISL